MDNNFENIRNILQLLGDKGLLAQGADGEILVSLKASELGFTMPISVAALPTIGVSSMPNLVVATMPSLTVGSFPSLTIGSIPSITANPTKPVSLAHGLLGASIGTLYTFLAAHRDIVIHVCNVDTAERTFTIQINATTPGAADDTHTRVKTRRLDVGEDWDVLIPGSAVSDVIYGLCDSANKVSYEIWGTP